MAYTFGGKGRSRIFAALILGAVILACGLLIGKYLDRGSYQSADGVELSGDWDFHNGSIKGSGGFDRKVKVPDPLPEDVRKNLAPEFWYRTKFSIPAGLSMHPISISLGSVKGTHEVYWNGQFLGAGGKVGLGFYRIPAEMARQREVVLTVKVKKEKGMYPGIVHMTPISVGRTADLEGLVDSYYFDTGVQPLIPAVIKLALFIFFIGFFAAVPNRREYLPFSLFVLCAAISSAFYSRYMPGYADTSFKHGMIFLSFTLSMSFVPWFCADFLRLPEVERARARILGFSMGIIFILAALFAKAGTEIEVYRMANSYLPFLSIVPSLWLCIRALSVLDSNLVQRKFQIAFFTAFLFAGNLAWSSGTGAYLRFQLFELQEFLDLVVCVGLAASVTLDFRQTAIRSQRASKTIPKWFSSFLSGGLEHVVLEIPMIALAVDTVGYTKKLAGMFPGEKEEFHSTIRALLSGLTADLGAQKISERGDGGIYAWDLPDLPQERERVLRLVLNASRSLALENSKISFRVGIACGMVRAEMRGGDFSFLGEPLNSAARLESIAQPGTTLVDESLVKEIPPGQLEKEWIEAEMKGVLYRAKPLRLAA